MEASGHFFISSITSHQGEAVTNLAPINLFEGGPYGEKDNNYCR